jgi:type IV secretion system T-DNA border endonuclease VirD2
MADNRNVRGFQDSWRSLYEVRRYADGRVMIDPRFRPTLEALAKRAPEAVFRVSGTAHGPSALAQHLNYITRDGELTLRGRDGDLIASHEDRRQLIADWSKDDAAFHPRTPLARYYVISYVDHRNDVAVERAGRAFAATAFGANHDFVAAFHTDTDNPHLHLTVRSFGEDGRQLHPKLNDFTRWRETWAEKLREAGLEAGATPRWVRGRYQKTSKSLVEHRQMERQRAERRTLSRRELRTFEDARQAHQRGETYSEWDNLLRDKRNEAIEGYRQVIEALINSPDRGDQQLGRGLLQRAQQLGEARTTKSIFMEMFRAEERKRQREREREQDRGRDRGHELSR